MRRLALLALLLLSVAVPAVALGSPTPTPLCSVCGDGFERAAQNHDRDVSVARSEAEVTVREDGTARWTVRNRLANRSQADQFRADSALLDSVVRDALGDGFRRPDADRVSDLSAHVEGHTVVVTFSQSSFADRVGGVLLVDYLHDGGDRGYYVLEADRFSILGPEGTEVVNDPATGAVGEPTDRPPQVTLRNDGDRYPESVDDTYVAFGPSEGPVQTLALRVVLAGRTLDVVLSNLAILVPAGLALVGGLACYRAASRWRLAPESPTRLAAAVAAVGALAAVHPLYAGSVPLVNDDISALAALGTAYLLVGGSALALAAARERVPWWVLLAPAAATPPVAMGLLVLLSYPTAPFPVSPEAWLGVPLAATFPLGYAVGRGRRRAWASALAVALGSAGLLALRYLTLTERPVAGGLVAILAAFLVAVGLLAGAPLYLLGESLSRTGPAEK